MINAQYIKSDGKIYEVVGFDGRYPITKLTDLKEIPVDKPLKKVDEEEEKPKRTRKK